MTNWWSVIGASAYGWVIGFQGLPLDTESELIGARYRPFNSATGFWGQRDDGYRDSLNSYLAFLAAPTNYVDPDGRQADFIVPEQDIQGIAQQLEGQQNANQPCCNGVPYDPSTQCCENNSIVAKVRLGIVIRDTFPGDHVDTILSNGDIVGWFGQGAEGIGSLKQLWNWDDPDVFTYAKYLKFRPSYISIGAAKSDKLKSKWCTFPVCPSQAAAVAKAWRALAAKGKLAKDFGFVTNNCVNQTCHVLRIAGINASAGGEITKAHTLLDSLKGIYGSQLKCRSGYFGYIGGAPNAGGVPTIVP
jgi:RHS repeat-associated protein